MRRAVFVVALALVAGSADAAVRWWEAYGKGVASAQARDWAAAVEQLEVAIAQKSTEALAAPAARNQSIEYVPHFWLGVAKFNLGDIEGATREWDISQAQGVIQRTQNYAVLQSYRAQARSVLDRKVSERSADSRRTADLALKRALGSRMNAMTAGADRLESYRAAGRKLQEAWDKFNGAGSDPAAYRDATAVAAEADQMFAAAADEARARKSARAAAPPASRPLQQPQRKPPSAAATAPAAAAPTPALSAPPAQVPQATATQPPPEVARVEVVAPAPKEPPRPSTQLLVARSALSRVQTKVDVARARRISEPSFNGFLASAETAVAGWSKELSADVDDDTAAEVEREITTLERQLSDQLKALAKKTPPAELEKGLVRAQLLNAYVAFANGRMEEAEAQLTALIGVHRDVAEAFLLRGCARYTNGVLTGDESFTRAAESDFVAALTLRPGIGLDPRHFSPKLIAALHDVRAKRR